MAIGYKEQSAASVPIPVTGSQYTFIDIADGKVKKKLSDGSIVDLEGNAAGVASFNTRTGAVTSQSGDYSATQITNTPAGAISATNVQAAINELDSEKTPISHVGSGGAQHADATTSTSGFLSASDKIKIDLFSTMSPNTLTSDVTVPADYTWIRQGRTKFAGSMKIRIELGAKIKFI
jgi:hypothetical protein